ncbi:SRPBCC domain-containing protein [Sinosporangium siamense]|uniref:Activator of Hsp90 ATPase homologue 1/2-like C-terminal domain-containing protein n=1 Tax=Sinosporangium siamense TaxID=1367973 RepID=A0A919V8T0_9ACTN|nr:SRPBCC domain-containing protein [Sinosporangium siamense]GII94758.1 hypothetical protein Ssi02_49890 [Sinosporangium siamense]
MSNLVTVNGRPALRFERHLAHDQARVWTAITEPAQLSKWYPMTVTHVDHWVGGQLIFDDGEGTTFTGTVTDFDPPSLFAFDEHDIEGKEREYDDHLRIELHPGEGGGCRMVFIHILTDPTTADGVTKGWQACLEALHTLLG